MILLEYFEIVAKCLSPYNISTFFCLQDGNELTETTRHPFSEHSHCQHLQTTLMLCRELDSPPQKLIVIASAMLNWIPMVIWAIEYACEGPSLRVLITQKYLVTLVISRPTEDLCNLLWPRQHSFFATLLIVIFAVIYMRFPHPKGNIPIRMRQRGQPGITIDRSTNTVSGTESVGEDGDDVVSRGDQSLGRRWQKCCSGLSRHRQLAPWMGKGPHRILCWGAKVTIDIYDEAL